MAGPKVYDLMCAVVLSLTYVFFFIDGKQENRITVRLFSQTMGFLIRRLTQISAKCVHSLKLRREVTQIFKTRNCLFNLKQQNL